MKKLRKILMFICISGTLLLTGCGTRENDVNNADSQNTQETVNFPEYYEGTDGIVTFDCEVLAPSDIKLNVCTARQKELNEEEIANDYMADKVVVSEENYAPGYFDYYLNDSSNISYSEGHVYINSADLDYVFDAFKLHSDGESNNSILFMSGKEFAFSSAADAEEECRQYLKDITGLEEFTFHTYSLDHQTLNEELYINEDVAEFKGIDVDAIVFTEEQDGYFFAVRQYLQGLPVFARGAGGLMTGESDANVAISAYYNAKGLRYFDITEDMLYDFEIGDEELKLLEFDEVAAKVSDYYNNLLTDNSFVVNRATLYNYVHGENLVTPVWIFQVCEDMPDGMKNYFHLDINAVTGEVLTRND